MIIWSADGAETATFPAVRRGTFASRPFSISGPTVWNELPPHIRAITYYIYQNFKFHLKIFYLTSAFTKKGAGRKKVIILMLQV
jgi:hypothetical protein